MPVDNELYNHLSDTWWDENEALGICGHGWGQCVLAILSYPGGEDAA